MLTSSAKAKGRKLQQFVRDRILLYLGCLTKDDVRSTSMGAQGSDVQLSPKAQELFNYAVECKAQEGYKKLYDAYEQAATGKGQPVVVIRSNGKPALAVILFDHFIERVTRQ